MEIRIGKHCYHRGFWYRDGRWAYIGKYVRINRRYFLGLL